MRSHLTVRFLGQTQILEVLFESPDPEFAAAFVNAMAAEYRAQSRDRMSESASHTAEMLTTQVQELKKSVDEAEKALKGFIDSNGLLVAGSERESLVETRLRQMQAALGVAHEARVAEQSRYEKVRSADPDSLAKVLESETLRAYRVKLTDLRQRLAEANQVYQPAHYKVRQIQAEIDEVQQAFERERASILARLSSSYDSAQFREESLRKDYERQAGMVADQMGKSVKFASLKRDVETRRQLYDTMLQKVKEAGLVSLMQPSNVRVVDAAMPPERPSKPNKKLYAALGLLTGLFYGIGFVFLRERRTLLQPAPVNGLPAVELPHLGSIPKLGAESKAGTAEVLPPVRYRALIGKGTRLITSGGSLVPVDNGRPEMVACKKDDSVGARAFQSVLDQVLFTSRRGKRPSVITVTSASHGEGRTTVVCNFASVLAQSGRVVLIIDGDRIHPRMHEIYRTPSEIGLADLISNFSANSQAAVSDAVWMTEVPGVYVLPGGRAMGRLASLVSDPRTTALFDRFCNDFDIILIDTPPVLSPGDTAAFCRQSDAVVFVVRDGRTSPDALERALRALPSDGAPVIGKITNYVQNGATHFVAGAIG